MIADEPAADRRAGMAAPAPSLTPAPFVARSVVEEFLVEEAVADGRLSKITSGRRRTDSRPAEYVDEPGVVTSRSPELSLAVTSRSVAAPAWKR